MSKFYNPRKSAKYLFDPASKEPFRISRSKIDLFVDCPLCFYLDIRLGVGRPPGFPLTLNVAVDELLKKEFDVHRLAETRHPFMEAYGIDAVPFNHPDMDKWRDSLKRGVEFVHPATNLSVRGGVDDIWQDRKTGELIVVDYKATSKREAISLEGDLGAQYKRQMEVYQWLLRQNGFKVADTGYFVYVNGNKDAQAFDKKLEFDVVLLPCKGDTSWVEPILLKLKECLLSDVPPASSPECDHCSYRKAARDVQIEQAAKVKKDGSAEASKDAGTAKKRGSAFAS
ncbi:MAG: PD-(D/E)XK nuclease family protein [Patescibacteria group bacterium]|nr:PD-(D/E)XK nuclease family protein [Patescibacteria group bacterium]MDE1967105.1 PD-(D/E)XK nuclease family protein [Patescibacteria group bacterium]